MIDYLQRAPFIRILLPFLSGILTESHVWLRWDMLVFIMMITLLTALAVIIRRAGYRRDILTGILFTLFFFLTGIFFTSMKNRPRNFPEGSFYQATVLEKPVEKLKSFKAEAMVTCFFSGDSVLTGNEKIIIYFGKSDKIATLKPGSSIVFDQTPREIENQGNPFEFDYKGYLCKKGISRQVFLKGDCWKYTGKDSSSGIAILAERTRDFLLDIYRRNGLSGKEFDILSALTLGYRKSMDPEITQAFAATGSTHVLSVSGLHVGIVYLMLKLALGFLRKRKSTRFIFLGIAVISLWVFAFITGLSPPVQRSALMFTIVLVGENLRRPANIYNTLACSAFFILVLDPNLVFDVGFQLSYAALFGIVYFQPRLDAIFDFPGKPVRYLWGLFTVSIAAQITTFPLSCYYFNQFPVYFWLSGFIVIPLSFAFIFLGIVILATSSVPLVSGFLAKIAVVLVKFLILTLQGIERIPGALLRGFNFPLVILLITIMLVVLLMLFMETKKLFYLKFLIILLIIGTLYSSGMKVLQNHQKDIIAYKTGEPVLHLIFGRSNYLLSSARFLKDDFPEWQVKPVIKHLRLKDPVIIPFEADYRDGIVVKKGPYLFFDGTVIWLQQEETIPDESIKPDVIILKQNVSKVENFPDGAILISYAEKFPPSSKKQMFHRISEMGAWRYQSVLSR